MAIRAAIREQLLTLRLDRRLALAVLLILLALGAAISPRLRELLLALLDPAELWLLLPWGLAALLLLVPIAGIVSLVSQYAFWEGWLSGLPDPATIFRAPQPGLSAVGGPVWGAVAAGLRDLSRRHSSVLLRPSTPSDGVPG
jgi:hypothetical protein